MASAIGTSWSRDAIERALSRVREIGVVGAGGGGFPTAVKLQAQVSTVIANAAECEPLLHKDKELLHHCFEPFLQGLEAAMAITGAWRGVIGVKEKYHDLIAALESHTPPNIRVASLPDVYPAGDEFILVNLVTGRIIPPGGLPKDVDAAVVNVETLVNLGLDRPVTHKYLTIAGAVHNPITVRVPIAMSIGEVIEAAGGATVRDFGVLIGGVMMAKPATGLDMPVTKTTGGLVILPASHKVWQRHNAPLSQARKIGRSACDQCRFCTEFCPRFLLGHPIQPHMAMQALGFSMTPNATLAGTLACCECNLCTMLACPEDLDPKTICAQAKQAARAQGISFKDIVGAESVHPMAEFRRVPMHRLIAKLGLSEFNNIGPLVEYSFAPRTVRILLKQHAGAAAVPVVKTGDRVSEADLVAAMEPGKLGAPIHASINGTVTVGRDEILIEAE